MNSTNNSNQPLKLESTSVIYPCKKNMDSDKSQAGEGQFVSRTDAKQSDNRDSDRKVSWRIIQLSDLISGWAVIISVLVSALTLAVYWESKNATKAAVDSAHIADSSLKHQRKMDSQRDISGRYKDWVDSVNQRSMFNLDSQSVQTQIDLLRQENDRFIVQNEPYLNVTKAFIQFDPSNNLVTVKFYVANSNKLLVKVDSIQIIGSAMRIEIAEFHEKVPPPTGSKFEFIQYNTYVGTQSEEFSEEYVAAKLVHDVPKGGWVPYLKVKMHYKNPITKRPRCYDFYYTFDMSKKIGVDSQYTTTRFRRWINDNYDLP